VAFRNALRDWPETDNVKREAMTRWLKSLAEDGPPLFYEMDVTGRFCRTIAPTTNVVEYIVVPSTEPSTEPGTEFDGLIGVLVIRRGS
jgi:hypothetical protein